MRTLSTHCRLRIEALEDRALMSTCHVTRLSDTGTGKGFRGDLRYCINKVNAVPGPDVIDFTVTGTINLNSPLPDLATEIEMQGPGAEQLTIRRHSGGDYGIFKTLGNVTISRLTISEGSSVYGAGIFNSGTLTVSQARVVYNVGITDFPQGVGIYNTGTLTLLDSTVAHNTYLKSYWAHGLGVYNAGNAFLSGSAITNNNIYKPHAYGSAFANVGTATLLNCTVSENNLQEWGSGILNWQAWLLVSHSTISHNTEIGINIYSSSTFVRNSIVANNYIFAEFDSDVFGELTASHHNLIGDTYGGSGFGPDDILNVDPMLGPLADNGGLTLTRSLLPGSPAIDAGDNADAPEFDQRGPGFPRIVNGTIDIGAFEVQSTGAPSSHGHFAVLVSPISEALKGRDMPAHGNALGSEANNALALKGRNQDTVESFVSIAPLQRLAHCATTQPRALPWADLFRPVGAEIDLKILL